MSDASHDSMAVTRGIGAVDATEHDHGSKPRIRAIRSVVVNARMRNWIFVKVETDQPGLYGDSGVEARRRRGLRGGRGPPPRR